ncbi:conjugal transfer protein TraN [Vibrio rotiferianus]|nr:conjugal transfer protein TraN [Vibrio rotiferianus]
MNSAKIVGGWILIFVQTAFPIWINILSALMYSQVANASQTFDEKYNQLLQQGAMGAANSVYNYDMPTLNTDTDHTLNPDEYFTDDTKKYFKSEVHAKDSVTSFNAPSGYTIDDFNEQAAINQGYMEDPNTINETLVDGDFLNSANDVDCSSATGHEKDVCEQRNNRKFLLDSAVGRHNFDSTVDYVLDATKDELDGTSPFIQQILGNDACSTVTTGGEDGEPILVSRQESCTRQYKTPTQECLLQRDMKTVFRATKTLYKIDTLVGVSNSPVNFISCGSGCNLAWLGTVGDNYLAGRCKIYQENIPLQVVKPSAIIDAKIDYAKWDDYMQIWLDNRKVWSGPNNNFPPETGGACELSTSWSRNPNTSIKHIFQSKRPGDILSIKNRVSVTGHGEAYARARITWRPSQVTWEHCRNNTGDRKPFRRICSDFVRNIQTPAMCSWALAGHGGSTIRNYARSLGCSNYFNGLNNRLNSVHKQDNHEPSGRQTWYVPSNVMVGNTSEGARKSVNPKFLNSCVSMLDKQNVPTSTKGQIERIYSNLGLDYRAGKIAAAYNASRVLLECPPITAAASGAPADLTGEHILDLPVMGAVGTQNKTRYESAFGINTNVTRRNFRLDHYQPGTHVPWYLDVHTDGLYDYEILDWGNPGNNWTIKLKLNLKYASFVEVKVNLHEVVTASFKPANDCQICPTLTASVDGKTYKVQGTGKGDWATTNGRTSGTSNHVTENPNSGRCYYGFQSDSGNCPNGWTKNPNGFCSKSVTQSCSTNLGQYDFEREKCRIGYQEFINNRLDGDLTCLQEVDAFETQQGVIFDNHHPGFMFMLPSWKLTIGTNDLPQNCYQAVLSLETEDDAFDNYECSTLEGKQKEDCLRGEICYPGPIPEDEVCYPLDTPWLDDPNAPLTPDHPECGEYVGNPNCTIDETLSGCIDWVDDAAVSGERQCVAEEVVFNCTEQTGTMPGTGDSSSLVCNSDIKCLGGECVQVTEETNGHFVEAATALKMVNEMRSGMNCADKEDPTTCRLFDGNMSRCRDYTMPGAPDCCSKSDTGVPSGGWVEKAKLGYAMFQFASHEITTKLMFQAWTGVTGMSQVPGAEWAGATYQTIVNGVNTYVTNPIISGWNSLAQSAGADWATMEQVTMKGAEGAVGTATGQMAAEAGTESVFGDGMAQYAAKGVVKVMDTFGGRQLTEQYFNVSQNGVVEGFTNEMANQVATYIGNVFTVIGWIYLAYQIYNILIGLLYACDEEDVQTVQQNETLNCYRVDKSCTSKSFWGKCLEYTERYCCYDSPFAKVFYKQAAIQLGERQGKSWVQFMKDQSCKGFPLSEVTTLDFDRMDFTEFTNLLMTPGILAYDPNAMPMDYKPQGKWSDGGANTGPGMNQLNEEAIVPGLTFMDEAHNDKRTDVVVNESEEMIWFDDHQSSGNVCYTDCNVGGKTGTFDSDLGFCVETVEQYATPLYSCTDPDHNLVGDKCKFQVIGPTYPTCGPGFELKRGKCVADNIVREPAIPSCPSGYEANLAENRCESLQFANKYATCSAHGSGFSIVGDKCVKNEVDVQPIQFDCPYNYSPSPTYDQCERIVEHSPNPDLTCDKGVYDSLSGKCLERFTKPIDKSCPSRDYVHDGNGNCVKTSVLEYYVALACPSGYTERDTKTCQRPGPTRTLNYGCKAGWTFENGDCVMNVYEEQAVGTFCENEMLIYQPGTRDCRKTYETSAAISCPTGYVENLNQCVKREGNTYTGNYVCP